MNTTAQHADITYQGGSWTQGQYPTCAAASTVMARAMVDPSYTLALTTGNRPDDPNSTSRDAFLARLREEQQSVYDAGRSDRDLWDKITGHDEDGMYPEEGEKIANEEVGSHIGEHYEHQDRTCRRPAQHPQPGGERRGPGAAGAGPGKPGRFAGIK